MAIVVWREEFNVNVQEIDQQHKTMLKLVNNIHCAVEARVDKKDLIELLDQLVEYTREHFSTEEQLMRKHDYPDLAEHHKEHKLLLQYLIDLLDAVSGGRRLTFYSDYDVSTDWALTHISEHDQDLGMFLNSKGVF